jgi:hypothetical protein
MKMNIYGYVINEQERWKEMMKKLFILSILFCWFPNQVHATVSEDWEKHSIADQSSPIYLYVKDMDGDNDLDVASTTNRHPLQWDSEVAWFRNNLDQSASWDKFIISSEAPEDDPITNTNGIIISDIDQDGYEDVVVGTGKVAEDIGSVYWFKAPKEPLGEWQRYDIEVDVANSYFKIYTLDINGDTLEDIIVGGGEGAALFINPENPDQSGASWEKIAFPEGMGSSFYLDDLNGDGKMELLNTLLHGNVSWIDIAYKNGEVVFDRTMIDADLDMAFDVNCMDINGDNKKDVIVTLLNQPTIYWYEAPLNDEDPWVQHVLSDTFSGTDIFTGDINGDLKTDLIVSGAFIDKLAWFEYRWEDGNILWTEHTIDDTINDPGDVTLNDLDGDGDLDVVVTGLREDQMIWYENKMPKPSVCPLEFLMGADSPHLLTFRMVRDNYLVAMPGGKWVIGSYYAYSEVIVESLSNLKNLMNFLN